MRIKVVGNTTAKNLALLLMKTMAEMKISTVNGASLYFGGGDEVIAVSAGGHELPEYKPVTYKQPKDKKRKTNSKTRGNSWEPKPSMVRATEIPADNGSCPWN